MQTRRLGLNRMPDEERKGCQRLITLTRTKNQIVLIRRMGTQAVVAIVGARSMITNGEDLRLGPHW
jgi:hypothetical protein